MFEYLLNIFKVPKIRKRLLITAGLLALYRLGVFIPIPGIDQAALFEWSEGMKVGGVAFCNFSILALGIMPFLSATILLQIFSVLIPPLKKLLSGGERERSKMAQYTYLGTAILCIIQSLGLSVWLQGLTSNTGLPIITNPGLGFQLLTVLTLTGGTFVLLLLAYLINRYGVGNGISLIFLTGIVSELSNVIIQTIVHIRLLEIPLEKFTLDNLKPFPHLFIIIGVPAAILILQGERRMLIHCNGKSGHLAIPLNTAGIMGIELASIIIGLLTIPFYFLSRGDGLIHTLSEGSMVYNLLYIPLVIYFVFAWASIVFSSEKVAHKLERLGISILKTNDKSMSDYLGQVIGRIAFIWAIFLIAIMFLPRLLTGLPFYIDGIDLIVITAIILDLTSYLKTSVSVKEGQVEYIELVKAFSHTDIGEIIVIKSFLSTKGIEAIVYGESYGRIYGFNWGPLAEKKILVREEDYQRTCECLKNLKSSDN